MSRKVEIFRAGKQTDSAGNAREWTEADLEKIASSYDPSFHEAPVCIGHPKDNAPAWAWVKKVTREGSSLFAEIGDEVEEFSEMLKKKMFKKRSISLYPDLSIRHLAFLGAQPPAVKGLKDMAFSDKGEPITLDFADWPTVWGLRNVGDLFQGLRDWFIETKDKETADRFIPQYGIDSLKTMQADPEKPAFYQESEMTQQEHETKLAAEVAKTLAAEAQAATFSEQLTAEKARVQTLQSEIDGIKAAAQDKDLADFCETLLVAGKILPANIPGTIAVMKSLAGQAEFDFAEGDKTVKKAPLAVYQEQLKAGPKVIDFGEFATKGGAALDLTDPKQLSDKAVAFRESKAKEGVHITISEAIEAVKGGSK